jgi:hypothetical protein
MKRHRIATITLITLAPVALALSACNQRPTVKFQGAQSGADSDLYIKSVSNGGDLFTLPASKIIVSSAVAVSKNVAPNVAVQDRGGSSSPNAQPKSSTTAVVRIGADDYAVSVSPVETKRYYIVTPATGFWSASQVNLTKIPNTDIVSSVSSQFTDYTKTRIDQLAGIITGIVTLAPMLAAESPDQQKCMETTPKLVPFTLVVSGEVVDPITIPGQNCWQYTLHYADGQPPMGVVSRARFEKDFDSGVGYFPVPACRDVQISLIGLAKPKTEGTRAEQTIIATISARIADPDYVRLAPLPVKGQITMHPICGADISDAAVDRFGGYLDDVNELFKQAKSIEDSVKKISSPGATAPTKPASSPTPK